MKNSQKSGKSTAARFTDDERAAMKERAQELKAGKADGESAVLAKIAEMPEPDRTTGERRAGGVSANSARRRLDTLLCRA